MTLFSEHLFIKINLFTLVKTLNNAKKLPLPLQLLFSFIENNPLPFQIPFSFIDISSTILLWFITVSYTHLDVYKRQVEKEKKIFG